MPSKITLAGSALGLFVGDVAFFLFKSWPTSTITEYVAGWSAGKVLLLLLLQARSVANIPHVDWCNTREGRYCTLQELPR